MKPISALLAILITLAGLDSIALARDPAQVRAFRKDNPCPATGKTTGACTGFVVNHLYPLCFGGKDSPENMAWQPYAESLKSDVFERAACAMKKKYEALKATEGK